MGRVMLAHQRSLQRDVAVKVVKPEIEDAAVLGGLLANEATDSWSSLEHLEHRPRARAWARTTRGAPSS